MAGGVFCCPWFPRGDGGDRPPQHPVSGLAAVPEEEGGWVTLEAL